ncbi:MAG: DUF615 domain-containing protein [Pseudomonadota bacterium]|nr:DUF615 domain-containing protein [Pseudomonadota bacterium]
MTTPEEPLLDDAVEPEQEAARPFDRNEHRAAMVDLKALTNRLAKLPQSVRRNLPLDEEMQHHLDLLAAADASSHRRRLLMRTKLLLSGADLAKVHAALEGDTPAAHRNRETARWRTRIVAGDDAVLQAFMEAYPGADRQGIRSSAREARGTGPAAARAQTRLLQQIRAAAAIEPESTEE